MISSTLIKLLLMCLLFSFCPFSCHSDWTTVQHFIPHLQKCYIFIQNKRYVSASVPVQPTKLSTSIIRTGFRDSSGSGCDGLEVVYLSLKLIQVDQKSLNLYFILKIYRTASELSLRWVFSIDLRNNFLIKLLSAPQLGFSFITSTAIDTFYPNDTFRLSVDTFSFPNKITSICKEDFLYPESMNDQSQRLEWSSQLFDCI